LFRTDQEYEDLDKDHIEKVLEIEKQAQAVYDAAAREAEQLPAHAEEETQALLEQTRIDARAEARRLIAETQAQAQDESARIMKEAEEEAERVEALAIRQFDHTVSYVLGRVTGKGQ
jgi:vacuolar-type H+-ATPase subunit H